jgi:hypothetical protein
MQTRVKTTRVFKTEPDISGKEELRFSRTMLDLATVSDYEEYSGSMINLEKRPMTTILCEFGTTFEYKVILMDFEEFHKLREKYILDVERNEGIRKQN